MEGSITEGSLLRLNQIIGQKAVSAEQAVANRQRGKGPRTPRPGTRPMIPVSKSTWWSGIKTGRYPRPVKISLRCTVWRSEEILALCRTGTH